MECGSGRRVGGWEVGGWKGGRDRMRLRCDNNNGKTKSLEFGGTATPQPVSAVPGVVGVLPSRPGPAHKHG
jgi:hypothetical protein